MPTPEERRNWGDPYIGLHLAAQTVEGITRIVLDNPFFPGQGLFSFMGSPTVFDAIADFLDDVLDRVDWFTLWFGDWLWPALTAIAFDIAHVPAAIAHHLVGVGSWLRTHLLTWYTTLFAVIGNMYTKVLTLYYNALYTVWWWAFRGVDGRLPNWGDIFGYLWDWVISVLNNIKTTIASIPTRISELWGGFVAFYWTQRLTFTWWWNTTFWPWLTGLWTSITAWYNDVRLSLRLWWATQWRRIITAVGWVVNTAWPWITGLPGRLWLAVQLWWKDVTWRWERWWLGVRITSSERIDECIAALSPTVYRFFGDIGAIPGNYMSLLASLAGTDLALQPHRALSTAGTMFAVALAAGASAHILSTALNALPFTNWVGASQLAGLVAQASGFDELTKATYGVLINDALTWPMRYHWNNMLRPKIPTEGGIFIMGRKRGLTAGEFRQAMAYQGLPDWWIDKEYQFFWTDPSPYWLLRMSEHATPTMQPSARFLPWLDEWLPNWRSDPWAWFKMKLLLAGFEDTDIAPFIEGFRQRRLGPARTQIKTSVRAMVREAYWGRAEAQAVLAPVGVRTDELEYMMLAEDIDYQNRYNDDQVRYYNESFRKGQISAQDLSLMLSTFIVRPERVAQIVAREVVRAMPKTKPPVTVRENPHVKRLISQAVSSWTKAWRDYEIEEGDLLLGLTIVLQDGDLAGQLVKIELTRYRPPPVEPVPPPEDPAVAKARRDAIAFRIEQFRDGEISAEVLELALLTLIPVADLVRQIVEIEKLRAVPVPGIIPPWQEDPALAAVRQETVRAHLEMFRKRLIGIEELFTYLLADGLARELARATTITQALKRIKTPPWDSPYFARDRIRDVIDEAIESYSTMFDLGQISIGEFRANAVAVGVDPDLAIYLSDALELRRFVGPEGVSY